MKKFGVFIVALVLSACAQLGMQTPDTFNKKIATAYVTVQTVAQVTESALQAGKITKQDATSVVDTLRASNAGIMAAQNLYLAACPVLPKTMETSDPKCPVPASADAKLASVLTVLTTLQAYLATQQGAK